MVAWLGMSCVTAAVMLLQSKIVPGAQISVTAWGLLVVVWLPFTVRLVERGTDVYLAALQYVVRIAGVLAILAVAMVGIQLLGIGYQDYFGSVVPQSLQLSGFVITYPMTYGSAIYKSNAFLGLEPSTISAQLGLGLLAAPLSVWVSAYVAVGLDAVGVAKIQTSIRVALAENRANCTLVPTIVAPRGVVAAAGRGARTSANSRIAGARTRRAGRTAGCWVDWALMV